MNQTTHESPPSFQEIIVNQLQNIIIYLFIFSFYYNNNVLSLVLLFVLCERYCGSNHGQHWQR